MSPCDPELGHPVDDINRQIETINLVLYGELEGRVDIASFLVAAHVEILVVGAAVGELVNKPGIAMKVEDYRLVHGEETVKVPVRQTVAVLGFRLQFEEVDDVDETDLKLRKIFPKQSCRRQGFHGGNVAGAGHYHVRFASLVRAGPIPDTYTFGAMLDGLIHI